MRVLSRRRKFAKAVACGYYKGAGFVVLTEPSPLPGLLLWVRATTRRRGVGELCPQAPRVCALGCLRLGPQPATGTHPTRPISRGHAATASGRRRVLPTALAGWGPSLLGTAATPELAVRGAVRGPPAEAKRARCDGVGRQRHLSTA